MEHFRSKRSLSCFLTRWSLPRSGATRRGDLPLPGGAMTQRRRAKRLGAALGVASFVACGAPSSTAPTRPASTSAPYQAVAQDQVPGSTQATTQRLSHNEQEII